MGAVGASVALIVLAGVFVRAGVADRRAAGATLARATRAELALEARAVEAGAAIARLRGAAGERVDPRAAAWELAHRATELGMRVERIDYEAAGPEVSVSAIGSAAALAELLLVVDRTIAGTDLAVRDLSVATAAHPETRLIVRLARGATGTEHARWDEADPATIAHAFRAGTPPRLPTAPGAGAVRTATGEPGAGRDRGRLPAASRLRWIGTISSQGHHRFVLLVEGKGTAVLAPGDPRWYGWRIAGIEDDRLFVEHEGVTYEVRR